MSAAPPGGESARDDKLPNDPMPKIVNLWHRGAAWIVGPLLIGLVAVLLAIGSEHAAA